MMKRDFQDKTFQLCSEKKEFSSYITGINDLKKCPSKELINDDFERMIMDSLYISPSNNCLVIIEHQSNITDRIMFRNLKYHVNTKYEHEKLVQLHIFHTGLRVAPKEYKFDNQVYYFPYLRQTYERNGTETFKKIKNKIKNNETSPYDIFDFIWLPRYGQIKVNDDFLKEYIDIASKLKNNEFYDLIRKTTVGWVDKLYKNEKIEEYLKEKLDMMSINSPEFRDYRATAKYEKALDEIKEKDEKIKEKDKKIEEKDKKIEEKDKKIEEKDKKIEELEKRIAKLEESNSS